MLKVNSKIREKLIGVLNEDFAKDYFLFDQLERLYEESSKTDREIFYSTLLFLLTHLEFSENEARLHWAKVRERFTHIRTAMNRDISMRVALIDYFTTDYKILKNPIVIEIFLYEITEKQAMVDELTGLYNFRHFQRALQAEYKRAIRYRQKFSIVFMDLDNLKSVNDKCGHLEGDDVLRQIGSIISAQKRTEDIVCRYGGDEFVFLLPQTTCDGTYIFMDRLRSHIEQCFSDRKCKVTVSAGIADYPDDSEDLSMLLEHADAALYEAKKRGKNQIIVWEPEYVLD